jgi:hypothetical protein
MSIQLLYFLGLLIGLTGAFFISRAVYIRVLKSNKRWVAFLFFSLTALVSFVMISYIILIILDRAVPFER